MGYQGLDSFVGGIIGPAMKYVPLIGTLFLYIFFMNIGVMIPGWGSATANINITAGLALVIFVYVQAEGIGRTASAFLNICGRTDLAGPARLPLPRHPGVCEAAVSRRASTVRQYLWGRRSKCPDRAGGNVRDPWLPAQAVAITFPLRRGSAGDGVLRPACIYIAMMTARRSRAARRSC